MATGGEEREISTGALKLLQILLSGNQWYKDVKTAWIAGELLVKRLPEIKEVTSEKELNVPQFIGFSEKQKSVCAQCMQFFLEKGAINLNAYAFELMSFLGLEPKD